MNLGIDGKTALVTASSQGLGRACALALAAEGVNVVICARGRDALEGTAGEITSAGGTAHAVVADVTDAGAADYLVQTTVGRFGGIDILVGNGGGPPAMRALEADDAAMARALNDNLLAMVRLVRAAVPRMVAGRWGRICLITSSAVKEPIPALALSNTARTGLWAWSKTAAQDLRQHGVTLNLACPGYHATDRLKTIGGVPSGLLTLRISVRSLPSCVASRPDSSAEPRCKSMALSRYWAFSSNSSGLRQGLPYNICSRLRPDGSASASVAMMLVRLTRSAADWWWTRQLRFLPVTSCAGSPR